MKRLFPLFFCLLVCAGCVAFPTVDVKGTALGSGMYLGLRGQYTDIKEPEDTDFGLYTDIGFTAKTGAEAFDPDSSFIEISGAYPLDDEDMMRVGFSGGLALLWGGYNHYSSDSATVHEAHISGIIGPTLSVSRYWGDTNRPWSADVLGTIDFPVLPGWFLFGTRYSWYEGAKGSSALMGYLWRGPEGTFELELGAIIDSSNWFASAGFETDDRYALALRWVFD